MMPEMAPDDDDDDIAQVPVIASPGYGAHGRYEGGTLYPSLLSDRTDSAERVLQFAELWRLLRTQGFVNTSQWERLVGHSMLRAVEE